MSDVGPQSPSLQSDGYQLVRFTEATIDDLYLSWLTDPEVTRYLEVRHTPQSRETALAFVRSFDGPVEKYMWAIQTLPGRLPIGTCTLYNVNRQHGSVELGLLIGDKRYWGQGASKEVITILADYVFGPLQLRRLTGGSYSKNRGMNFTYRVLGFTLEGTLRRAYRCGDEYVDGYRWGLLAEEWHARRSNKIPTT